MPIDLATFAAPSQTAMLTMEMQNAVVGPKSNIPPLAQAVAEGHTIENCARLAAAAREAGVRVVHCLALSRPDGAGSSRNTPMQARGAKSGGNGMVFGSENAALVSELGPDDRDIICGRIHGMSPFTGTELDAILRNLGVKTVIATGVSVNVGVLGMCIEAVGLGYTAIVPMDAVAGFPREHVESIFQHTLAAIATRTTVDALIAAWK